MATGIRSSMVAMPRGFLRCRRIHIFFADRYQKPGGHIKVMIEKAGDIIRPFRTRSTPRLISS
ncbi:MAG TPA: hypothetical protein DEB39_04600 [Planctomycetaceae bacterium]|nr:hypothetical protein [Planctomycetaceae bacterium]